MTFRELALAPLVVAALALSGCAVYDAVVEPTAGVIAKGIDRACESGNSLLAMEARRGLVAEINSKTQIANHTPTDCDGDGLPDFNIDANGQPLPDAP